MKQKKNYAAIDNFRLAAALLIVAIHTSPFASFSDTLDFLLTYCLARVGVPFFFMVTGFFVLAPFQKTAQARGSYRRRRAAVAKEEELGKTGRFLKKTMILYAASTLLYLPLKLYAGNLSGDLGGWLKEIFFDGTFYHLWYLPAVILGCLLVMGLLKFCSPMGISVLVFVLYVLGVLGDSYYYLVSRIPFVKAFYEGIFAVSSYTRNGIFFAPLFLWMGVLLANGKIGISQKQARTGLLFSLAGMLAEGYASYYFQWQKHNSMYFLLIPVMFFLFELLLLSESTEITMAREVSMYLYILHPWCIVLVRGAAGALELSKLLVEQSLAHYAAVAVLAVFLSYAAASGKIFLQRQRMEGS